MTAPADLDAFRPTERFSDRASDYVRFRPSYPPAAIDAILEGPGLGDPSRLVAADVGAGTGISARLLADRGVRVHAVEPNAAMRSAAAPHAGVSWHDGRAQATGLPAGSVGLALCAQSFHWFDEEPALRELHRILIPSGRLALMWNRGDRDDETTRSYYDLVHAAAGEGRRGVREWGTDADRIAATGLFTRPVKRSFRNRQVLSEDGLLGRALSASYAPKSGPAHDALLSGLRALHARMRDAAGHVTLHYRTDLWLATRT